MPIQKYETYKRDQQDLTDTRLRQIRLSLIKSSARSDYVAWNEFIDWQESMTTDDAWRFLDQLRNAGLAERTVEEYMRIVQSFLAMMMTRGVVESNPIAYVIDEAEFEIEESSQLELTVSQLGNFIKSIPKPHYRASALLHAKNGIRNGENNNIDLPHLHLDHPDYYRFLEKRDIELHEQIKERPDSLYIPSEPTIGEEYNGEVRGAGNKRKNDTIIPIDMETKFMLLNWLAVRPLAEYPHPLWVTQDNTRVHHQSFRSYIKNCAVEAGLIDDTADRKFSVHWFRHFFTTQLRPGHGNYSEYLEPTMIKYLRGDVEDDIMEVYTHDWGNTIRAEYIDSIYQFGIYE
ncbi:integrase family protein [Natrialba hulunbeirensis JCM 10989]|uniref:Integrase family protein n=2 Tax=Natrialba hulunbeirensis TaxID=123783 RepID=M0A9R6_9EURY|nr:integrase family protein [Natrialba hulunbeirensis JCM 10989]